MEMNDRMEAEKGSAVRFGPLDVENGSAILSGHSVHFVRSRPGCHSWFFILSFCFLSFFCVSGCEKKPSVSENGDVSEKTYARVVSLTPAVTEIIYALGREDRLIGVSKFCQYPPEAQEKMIVGGFYDANREVLVTLSPDVVFLQKGENDVQKNLENVGIRTHSLELRSVEAVYESIQQLGVMLQAEAEAETLVTEMKNRMETLRMNAEKMFPVRKRVLLVVGRNYDGNGPEEVYITGNDGFCNALVEAAGGENAYTGRIPFPKVSLEGILLMNPDVIVESVPEASRRRISDEEIVREWKNVDITAVKNGAIYLMDDRPALIPGVSMVGWAEKLQEKLAQ